MSGWLEWLLDLERIELTRDAPLMLQWQNAVPAWMLFCFALAAGTWIVLIYRRERASLAARVTLVVVRTALVALIAAVICQPALVWQRNRVEPSYVAVAVDTSLSMATRESYRDQAYATSIARGAALENTTDIADHSRLELVQKALTRQDGRALSGLLARNGLQLCTFAGALESVGFFPTPQTVPALIAAVSSLTADGGTTDLAGAIAGVIHAAQGRRLAAIVLATDGQTTQPTSLKDALDLVRDRQIPIFPISIGSIHRPRDVEVGPLRAEDHVFLHDLLAVETELSAHGLTEPTTVTVRLIDERSDTVVATEEVTLDASSTPMLVELRAKPDRPGTIRYRVEAVPLSDEHLVENNTERVEVVVMESELRVLYVDAYPRYEYRYLKNALLRESMLKLSVLLLEADERFVQEGTEPIRRFPETPEELSRYDVILFGDVDPRSGWLSAAQMKMLLDFVGNRGGGFGLIAGERAAPHRFAGTPLEKLVPIRIDPTFLGHYEMSLTAGFQGTVTREGQRSRILRFLADRTENEQLVNALPRIYWVARTLGPKPGASVLMEHPTVRTTYGALPLVVTGRYGAGRLFFQATDDTWRWRRHTGELLHDSYWVRVVRELMPQTGAARDRRFLVRTDRRAYPYGQSVRAEVEILDSRLLAEQDDTIQLVVSETSPATPFADDTMPGEPQPASFDDIGAGVVVRLTAHRLGPESNRFEGTWVPRRAGRFSLQAAELLPPPGERAPLALFRVSRPDLESRRPEADHATLERIAAVTGGQVLALDALAEGLEAIRDRSVQIPDDVIEPLWDSRLVLLLFGGMISVEWILRKAFGLL